MNGLIEALYIYDDQKVTILSHIYAGRPVAAAHLLPLYLKHPVPRPSLIYLPHTVPPTLVFSLQHASLLYLATSSSEIEPLLVLEFLHRVVEALQDFLGAPLQSSKIESNYDVVAQLLSEMCDAGLVNTTEPNALHEVVEVEGWVDKLLGNLIIPGKNPTNPTTSNSNTGLTNANHGALQWRRAGVRHISNEMYADVVESLSIILAPSGRPLTAFAHGTIAFTSRLSGVPDIVMTLTSPSGKHTIGSMVELPVFHPCVRLSRWKERPGELSFIPPDGRCVLAGYGVDLLPISKGGLASKSLKLPVGVEVKTSLGPTGSEFEVRIQIHNMFSPPISQSTSSIGRGTSGQGRGKGGPHAGTPGAPLLENLVVSIPLPAEVRNIPEIRPSKGDASYNPGEQVLEWNLPNKAISAGTTSFSLHCLAVGRAVVDEDREPDSLGLGFESSYAYDEPYQIVPETVKIEGGSDADKNGKKIEHNKSLMPTSASISFSVKGWLASGLRLDSMGIDYKNSRGLGDGVKPYKGVKYLTISKGGIEARC